MTNALWWIGYLLVLVAFIGGAVNNRRVMWLGLLGGLLAWGMILAL